MDPSQCKKEVRGINRNIPAGPRLGVIGSASFWGKDSKNICAEVGVQLAALEELIIITGGVPGVGEVVGRNFFNERMRLSLMPNTFHILPRGMVGWDYGVTLFGGDSLRDRRLILGRLAPIYLAVEGGPGTEHEARVVLSRGAHVIPIGRTGGASKDLFAKLKCPGPRIESEWKLLNEGSVNVEQIGGAVRRIVANLVSADPKQRTAKA
jgi:hypothetical protein